MTAARTKDYVPYDVFLRNESASEGRHEWVDGAVYAMSGAQRSGAERSWGKGLAGFSGQALSRGSPEHGRLTARVTGRVLSPLLDEGCETFAADTPIFIEAAQHHTYADASLVCGALITRTVKDRNGKSIEEAIVNPVLIVEVLSAATERYDRDGKFEAYKKLPSFEEYVLVSQDERRIEVRTRKDQQWTTQVAGAGEIVRIHGRDVAVDAIYA